MKISPINNTNIFQVKKKANNAFQFNGAIQNTKQITSLSNCYYTPINFGAKGKDREYSSNRPELFERPSDFKLSKFDNIPCPACGKIMMTRQKFEEFQQRLDETSSDKYLYLLGEYQQYMRPIEQSVYNELLELSSSAETTDIRELLVILRETKLPQLQNIQKRKLTQMKKIARTLPAEERAALSIKLNELGKQIRRKNEEAPFRRKKMLQEIKEVKIANPYKYEKLQNLAKAFPTSKDTNSAWITKYSGKNKYNVDWASKDIAERMLSSSVPNVDHIIPYGTERNHDDIGNYLAMHSGCNCTKSNKPFMEWYNENPEIRQKSLNAYFEKVSELLSSGKISDPKYREYVANATETIKNESFGEIVLNQTSEDTVSDVSLEEENDETVNIVVEE